ncbi:hypothetical protein ACLOJK_026705, partial [Asimina triloba]
MQATIPIDACCRPLARSPTARHTITVRRRPKSLPSPPATMPPPCTSPSAHATLTRAACRRRRLCPPSPAATARYRLIQWPRSSLAHH